MKLPTLHFLNCPESNRNVFAWLLCFAILSSLLLIANPGFYSYDELKKADYIMRHGFWSYVGNFVTLQPGQEFAAFAGRPVAYLVEGIALLFLPTYPTLAHLFQVLLHGATAYFLFVATQHLTANRRLAWAGALIFLINPLITFSVGWTEAIMDSLYILFGLIALIAAHKYITQQGGRAVLLTIFGASMLAILSKETAVILPLVLLHYPLFSIVPMKNKRLGVAFLAWVAPVFVFILYRFFAFANSAEGESVTAFANVPEGIFTYFTYPFMPLLTESHTWGLHSTAIIGMAVICHLGLLFMVWLSFSFRAALAYLLGYFLFLIPILFLPATSAHYLYGSGIAFSLVLSALLVSDWKQVQKIAAIISGLLLVVSIFHALVNQHYLFKTGSCMSRISNTVESAYLAEGKPDSMVFFAEADAPGYVLARFLHSRETVGNNYPVKLRMFDWDKRNEVKSGYTFNCDCFVHKPAPFKLKIGNWGPQSTIVNANPNKQPDGSVGFWMEVENTTGVGELQLLVSGQPALKTSVQEKMITATFSADLISQPSEIEFAVKQLSTGQVFPVGTFIVEAKK